MKGSKTVKVLVLFAIMKRRIKTISFRSLLGFLLKVGSSAVAMAALHSWLSNKLHPCS